MLPWIRIKKRLEWLGHLFFYAMLAIGGQRTAYFFLYPVVFFYILGSRKIHRRTLPYLRRRFPDHSRTQLFLDVFRNVLSFGRVLVDRGWMGLKRNAELTGTFTDSDQLQALIREGNGVVILLAHVGNWQTSLARLDALEVGVHALMEFDEQSVSKHFFELRGETPFRIIDVHGFMGGMIEAATALQQGDLVLMMGDRLHQGRHTRVSFLGDQVRLPVAAYHLAMTAGAPVVFLFGAKTGRREYALGIGDILYPGRSGLSRDEELKTSAQKFAAALERYVEQYPYQWYNFFNIWQQ